MFEIYDDAGLSRRERAKLVAELMAKASEVTTEVNNSRLKSKALLSPAKAGST